MSEYPHASKTPLPYQGGGRDLYGKK